MSKQPGTGSRRSPAIGRTVRGLNSIVATALVLAVAVSCTSMPPEPPTPPAATVAGIAITGEGLAAAGGAEDSPQSTAVTAGAAAAPQADEAARRELTQRIQHQLLEQVNSTLTPPVTDGEVTAVVGTPRAAAIADQLDVPEAELPARIKDVLVLTRLVDDAIKTHTPVPNIEVQIAMITYPDLAQARAKEAAFRLDPQSFTELVDSGVDGRTAVQIAVQTDPALASTGVFSLPVGTMMTLSSGDSGLVARIDTTTTTTAPIPDDTDLTDLRALQGLGGLLLTQATVDSPVVVDPRFGSWDPAVAQVVPHPGEV
ncbi:hypothetical protein D1871_14550 [Nakamurella silvestris]|nr:hypothetical protein D1871_14550 [Nakamurella silvestris]